MRLSEYDKEEQKGQLESENQTVNFGPRDENLWGKNLRRFFQ
jgi:hypothetical protein